MRALVALRGRLAEPVDAASLAAFRVLLGTLLVAFLVRLWRKGVIEQAFVIPKLFFPLWGFGWLPPPGAYAYVLYAVLGVLALALALGLWTRAAAGLFCLLFTYAHSVDATNYLNHYYLVTLLTGLFAVVPTGGVGALCTRGGAHVPRWVLWLFRFQLGVVYFFGGIAKLKHDWLVLGQPLRTWLAANTDVFLLGPLFARADVALLMSWLGAIYDLTIPFLLCVRRTRPYAFVAVVAFHALTARLFMIGLFPYLMVAGSLLFLSPSWPRRLVAHLSGGAARDVAFRAAATEPLGARTIALLGAYVLVQLLAPLRHHLYPGHVLWTEQGYRFAWHVMLMEKTGTAEYTLVDRATGLRRVAFPRTLLTRAQTKAMATQPDMILQLAHALARRERAAGRDVAVYADVFVVLNGRPPRRLVDPAVDLAREPESLAPKRWLLPGPDESPSE